MAKIKIHLSYFPTLCDAILTNLSIFRMLFEKNKDSAFIELLKKRKVSNVCRKKKKSQTGKSNMEHVAKLIEILNWDMTKFIRE